MPDVEQALDELYGVDPDQFMETRTRLSKQLKDAGDSEAASVVASARKPTIAAWVLNQLARKRRKDVDLLLDAGHRLGRAQARLLQGEDQSAFASARKAEQSAVANLTKQARALLHERDKVSQSTLDQVNESLRAAAIAEDGRALLATGRFAQAFSNDGGFDALAALAPAGVPSRSARLTRSATLPIYASGGAGRAGTDGDQSSVRRAAPSLRRSRNLATKGRARTHPLRRGLSIP